MEGLKVWITPSSWALGGFKKTLLVFRWLEVLSYVGLGELIFKVGVCVKKRN